MGKNIYNELQNMKMEKQEENIKDFQSEEVKQNDILQDKEDTLAFNLEMNDNTSVSEEIVNEKVEEVEDIKKQIDKIVNLENEKVQDIKQDNNESISYIEISKLVPYGNQPFNEYTDEEKDRMKKSIEINGIIHPIIIRPLEKDLFQILSGHNRVKCAKELEMKVVPCIIKNVDDDIAKLIMVETNLVKRENLSIMSQAKAYKIQSDIYKKKNIKLKNSGEKIQENDKVKNKFVDNQLSYRQILRLIKLNDLIEELQPIVDSGKLQIKPATQMATLSKNVQKRLYSFIKDGTKFNEKQIKQIKEKEHEEGTNAVTTEYISSLIDLKEEKSSISISFSKEEIEKYFNNISSQEELKKMILEKFSTIRTENGGDD